MKKIPTLFVRDWEGNPSRVTREIHPDCQWVLDGEGIASRKWDGTACKIDDAGILWRRYDAKTNRKHPKPPPYNFRQAMEPDGDHWAGWVPVGAGPEDQWINEALTSARLDFGTYECIGPKIGANPENVPAHILRLHGDTPAPECPRDFDGIRLFLVEHEWEGVVWRDTYNPNDRMCKIKRKDFGLEWPIKR